jgi:hypothetical protein
MKIDALRQYAQLRQQLTEEQSELQTRLNEINQVLGNETAPSQASRVSSILEAPSAPSRPVVRRGRKPKAENTMSMREAVLKALSTGPLARNELVEAVENVGYVFTTKNPLNSIGSVLYGKKTPVKSRGGKFYLPGVVQPETPESNGGAEAEPAAKKGKFKRSAAARARMAAAQKASWARRRKGK